MIILQALYLMLPAYCANMAPVFATKIFGPKLAWPLDGNLTYQGQPILGKNKTWRGLICAIIVACLVVVLQRYLLNFNFGQTVSLIDYNQVSVWLLGFLLGLGVILGDAIKSFFKRRAKLAPGAKWFPWDQLDFLGALVLLHFVFIPAWPVTLLIVIISPFLPLLSNWLGFNLKLKKVAW